MAPLVLTEDFTPSVGHRDFIINLLLESSFNINFHREEHRVQNSN